MPGNGKSYLAAAALRSPEIWKTCFSDGIYWLDIGKPGKDKLLVKMGSLQHMVDDRSDPALKTPSEIEMVVAQLAKAVAQQHPNSALVLDDVWDTEVIRAFDKVSFKVNRFRSGNYNQFYKKWSWSGFEPHDSVFYYHDDSTQFSITLSCHAILTPDIMTHTSLYRFVC